MTRPNLCDIKPDFLSFIVLLYNCRKAEIGRTGPTRIKLRELQPLLIGPDRVNEFVRRLVFDGVLREPESAITFELMTNSTLRMEGGDTEIELYSLMTKEQILEYRHSLTRSKSQQTVFNAMSWESVIIMLVDSKTVHVTVQGSDNHEVPATYATLGFINKRNNQPNEAWRFLLLLLTQNGSISKYDPLIVNRGIDVTTRKKEVKRLLQEAFNITHEDPFKTLTRRNQIVELKCIAGLSEQYQTPVASYDTDPESAFDETRSHLYSDVDRIGEDQL